MSRRPNAMDTIDAARCVCSRLPRLRLLRSWLFPLWPAAALSNTAPRLASSAALQAANA